MAESPSACCPDCGKPLTAEAWAGGLCLTCLADLARLETAADDQLHEDPREAPHLFLGHSGAIDHLAIDPLGRWVVASGQEETRFWPMPDLSKTPTHLLPRDELLALLRAQTNARLIEDPEDPTGWAIDWEPFPGWEHPPPAW